MTTTPARPTYLLLLTPTGDGPPAEHRLRSLLKQAQRQHGLRAVCVGPMPTAGEGVREAFVERLCAIAKKGTTMNLYLSTLIGRDPSASSLATLPGGYSLFRRLSQPLRVSRNPRTRQDLPHRTGSAVRPAVMKLPLADRSGRM